MASSARNEAASAVAIEHTAENNTFAPSETVAVSVAITLPTHATWNPRLAQAVKECQWKLSILAPALAFHKRSKGRGLVLADLAKHPQTGMDGKPVKVPVRTLRRWLATMEEEGKPSLARKRRADASTRRCAISHAWDRACPLSDVEKRRIATEIDVYMAVQLLFCKYSRAIPLG